MYQIIADIVKYVFVVVVYMFIYSSDIVTDGIKFVYLYIIR